MLSLLLKNPAPLAVKTEKNLEIIQHNSKYVQLVKLGLLTNGMWAEIMYSVFMPGLRKSPF